MSKRALWTVVIMATLGMLLYVGKVGANCIVPMSPSAADPNDVMYIVRGADGVYRFTIQNSNTVNVAGTVCGGAGNCATTFGVGVSTSAQPLGGNPFASGVTDTNGNGFADTLGSSSGFTNVAPYTTLPGGSGGATDPECHSFCSTTLTVTTDAATSVDPDAMNSQGAVNVGGCATELLVRGDDTNIYRTAFRESFPLVAGTATYGSFDASLANFDSATTFPGDGSASGEDGFPGVHGTTVPWSKISP